MDKLRFDDTAFHDAQVTNYKVFGNNITFLLQDGWLTDRFYDVELKNAKIEIMNNKPEIVSYIYNEFNNMDEWGINLYAGDYGKDENKYFLKLWIRYPSEEDINNVKINTLDVALSNDSDDTGHLYIKFICDELSILRKHFLFEKYDRLSKDNINNLNKCKGMLSKDLYNLYLAEDMPIYVYNDITFNSNNIRISYKYLFNENDLIYLNFINVSTKINDKDMQEFINILNNSDIKNALNLTRIIEYSDNKFKVGFLKSRDEEFIINCDDIKYEGKSIES